MSGTRTVLLVEDQIADIELTLLAFERSCVPCRIVIARTGEEALDYLFKAGHHAQRDRLASPDLVLLDLRLPGSEGLEVLRRMRLDPWTKIMPVVVLTASNKDEIVIQSYELGANSFVRKPVDFGRFIAAAKQLGIYWFELSETPRITRGPASTRVWPERAWHADSTSCLDGQANCHVIPPVDKGGATSRRWHQRLLCWCCPVEAHVHRRVLTAGRPAAEFRAVQEKPNSRAAVPPSTLA